MSPSISALHVTTPPRHWLDSAGGHPHGHQVCTLVCTDIHTNIISRCTHTYEPQNRHTPPCLNKTRPRVPGREGVANKSGSTYKTKSEIHLLCPALRTKKRGSIRIKDKMVRANPVHLVQRWSHTKRKNLL